MAVSESVVRDRIAAFQRQFRHSQEPEETLLDVIGKSESEQAWQRLLAYFISTHRGHGFGTDLLAVFLETVQGHTSISGLDGPLETVRVDVEVKNPSGRRMDLVLFQEGEWFLCVEIKVHSSEHRGQTQAYLDAEYIESRAKSNFPVDGHHYLYLTAEEAHKPSSDEFEHLTWTRLEDRWSNVLEDHRTGDGSYPTRGVAQFAEFLKLIRAEAGEPLSEMSAYYEDIQAAKRAYEDLAEVLADAFEQGIKSRYPGSDNLRIRRRRSEFPQFEHGKYNRLEIDKPLWRRDGRQPRSLSS